jgi:hypothetical protein
MRHRLYYLLPNVDGARHVHNDLLLSRIEHRHIHFLTNGEQLPPDVPEANLLQKSDLIHGAEFGMTVGGFLGLGIGCLLLLFPIPRLSSEMAIVTILTIGGILFGGWASGMIAIAMPNTRLRAFYPELEKGKVLLMVDVPSRRIREIEEKLSSHFPDMSFKGEDPHIPVFP